MRVIARVLENTSSHHYEIGEEIVLRELLSTPVPIRKLGFKAAAVDNNNNRWCVSIYEIEIIEVDDVAIIPPWRFTNVKS